MKEIFSSLENDSEARSRIEGERHKTKPRTTGSASTFSTPSIQSPQKMSAALCIITPPQQVKPMPTKTGPSELCPDNRQVTEISGTVSRWLESVTFHYIDGTSTTYAAARAVPEPTDRPPTRFPLHAEEHITAVLYARKRAALTNSVLGCGIEFETSFGRSCVLCGRPDACFSWENAGKAAWRAPPGHCIVGLCLAKVFLSLSLPPAPYGKRWRAAPLPAGGGSESRGPSQRIPSNSESIESSPSESIIRVAAS
jgi:hypothetical protein